MYKYIPSIPIYASMPEEILNLTGPTPLNFTHPDSSNKLYTTYTYTLWIESRPCAKYYDAQF